MRQMFDDTFSISINDNDLWTNWLVGILVDGLPGDSQLSGNTAAADLDVSLHDGCLFFFFY